MSPDNFYNQPLGNFNERSGSAQEIISKKPGFIENWALCFILIFIGMIFVTSSFIRLPELFISQAILTEDKSGKEYFATMEMSEHEIKNVATGMKVQLRFEKYPFYEVGYVNGTIKSISKDKHKTFYVAIITLDSGLYTNRMKKVTFTNGLKARAFVITRYTRMSSRFLDAILSAFETK